MNLLALWFDTVVAKEWLLATIELHQFLFARKYGMHKLFGTGVDLMVVYPYFTDVFGEVVTDRPCREVTLKIDQRRCRGGFTLDANLIPEPAQVGVVTLKRIKCLILACSTNNQPHVVRHLQLGENLFHGTADVIR